MLVPFTPTSVTGHVGNLDITLETGRMANQTNGTVLIKSGGTVVLVTAVGMPADGPRDFFPLTCNYLERTYAAGRIPGGYFRREVGRPSDRETLVSRLMDRPIRPMFPKAYRDEVQVIATVLSADTDTNPDVLAMTGASAALHISDLPFNGPVAAARVGLVDNEFVLYPTYKGVAEQSDLNLVFAATRDAVIMVEGSSQFLSENTIAEALEWGHEQMAPMFDLQDALREKVGRPKLEVSEPEKDEEVITLVTENFSADLDKALTIPGKLDRKAAKSEVKASAKAMIEEKFPEEPERAKAVGDAMADLEKKIVRKRIVEQGVRIDGRDLTTVRNLSMEVSNLPMTHGSALFRRGETSALAVCTLGSTRDEQRFETLIGEDTKRFMLHYNFPPYCVGEAKFLRAPSRREIGHGTLAERALRPVLPKAEDFPFTMRVVSEVMDSNGSSSMATVCGTTLSLMDAGVPISAPVAGIAMGLCQEGDEYFVLTDILGDEDALGDMDFKVAGTEEGITAIQMDIKISGIPADVLRRALAQAKDARQIILDDMKETMPEPRAELSVNAPQMEVLQINPEKIRDLIGPGGKNIKAITAETSADIDIEDSGKVSIFAPTLESLKKTVEMVQYYDQTAELGKNYVGTVKKILEIGAIVEILPGLEGLLHISQIDVERIAEVTDVVQLGQEITVKVVEVQPNGRIRLSRKAWLMEQAGQEVDLEKFKMGGGRPGGNRGGRDGGRRDDRRDDRRGGGRRDDRRRR
ncbi:polyribonucleotide nucleotidyltransferase [Maridesulfovibrio salexigens]|uniref:Polyribonucleotide nucleotidyltransferase n=1 Tax=Maridesulfovibrio salexigens (strain ATCC 14822 / DSM 2638 / NCIMB 8403 / VKM B-1763) TaxID=526222 RepID=C6C0C7_MARSD|nr:polyribonucleotide nucleotidyltransferase [Maridesulfovibrio salexigens]ACS79061.1 Polyribonucleotide nucleotidyltransferase [Maridesulfovibrio salexigens DSM 2638]